MQRERPNSSSSRWYGLIQRSAFERIRDSFPDIEYRLPNSDHKFWNFFGCVIDPESKLLLGEDYSLSWRAAQCGIQSYLLARHRTVHHGSHSFIFNREARAEMQKRLEA